MFRVKAEELENLMINVIVVMSTYNGEDSILVQLDSIFSQRGVKVKCFIRDDGSRDRTVDIINQYKQEKGADIELIIGENVGWKRSFLLALSHAPKADYYAFADQDDYWLPDKLISGINALSKEQVKILLYHCNRVCVNEKQEKLKTLDRKFASPISRKGALSQEYVQGCSIIINSYAKELICMHLPNEDIPHDFWCGLVCFLFGKTIYDNIPHLYYVRHNTNATNTGDLWKSRITRLKGQKYVNPALDLLEGYRDMLPKDEVVFLNNILLYKKNIKCKLRILFSREFRRNTVIGTMGLKLAILLNKY